MRLHNTHSPSPPITAALAQCRAVRPNHTLNVLSTAAVGIFGQGGNGDGAQITSKTSETPEIGYHTLHDEAHAAS